VLGNPAESGALKKAMILLNRLLTRVRNKFERNSIREFSGYLTNNAVGKLHIGASSRLLEGWLNTDIAPSPGIMRMDATKPFPFDSSSFDYVFAEHMIEHVSSEGAMAMLTECHRILRPGGVLRIVTPDLEKLAGLYKAESAHPYLAYFCETFLAESDPKTVGSLLNAQFRMWGHQFLYDETLLTHALRSAGFNDISRTKVGESTHAALSDIENEDRYPEGFLEFESLTIEAIR
jgi:predicted SAM-dependent methyltransferase